MIPASRPAFGLADILASWLHPGDARDVARWERAMAEAAGVAEAVWLPSARAGICWALQAAGQGLSVVAPAFTCSVVHEAVLRSGSTPYWVDATKGDFLLPATHPAWQLTQPHAVLWCEVYGHTYDWEAMTANAVREPELRIVDMAMSVLDRSRLQQLQSRDWVVISFGPAKGMYAGFGGVGLTPNRALAAAVRRLRDATLIPPSTGQKLRRSVEIVARTVLSQPGLNGLVPRRGGNQVEAVPSPVKALPPPPTPPLEGEWRFHGSILDRRLALWHLPRATALLEQRRNLTQRYHQNLAGAKDIVCPPAKSEALCCYTIRVAAARRGLVKARLRADGVAALNLWAFSRWLDSAQYPEAFQLSAEVLNLPLAPWMSLPDVDRACAALMRALAAS